MTPTTRGAIYGCTLGNNASNPNTDIDFASGTCASDDTSPILITAPGMTKRLDLGWSVGNFNGMRSSAAPITNDTYHLYVVSHANGSNVDYYAVGTAQGGANAGVAISLLQAEAGGSAYTKARRLGSILRTSGAILGFRQRVDRFMLATRGVSWNSAATSAVAALQFTVPSGIRVRPIVHISQYMGTSSGNALTTLSDGESGVHDSTVTQTFAADGQAIHIVDSFYTDTSANLRFSRINALGTGGNVVIGTIGWYDDRGQTGVT